MPGAMRIYRYTCINSRCAEQFNTDDKNDFFCSTKCVNEFLEDFK